MANQVYIRRGAISGAICLLILAIIIIVLYFTEWRSPSPTNCDYCFYSSKEETNLQISNDKLNSPTGYYCCPYSGTLFCCDMYHQYCCPNLYAYYPTNLCCNRIYQYTCPSYWDQVNCVYPVRGVLNLYSDARETFQNEIGNETTYSFK